MYTFYIFTFWFIRDQTQYSINFFIQFPFYTRAINVNEMHKKYKNNEIENVRMSVIIVIVISYNKISFTVISQ